MCLLVTFPNRNGIIYSIVANIIRSATSGEDWTLNELFSYNIVVHRQSPDTFFGYTPSTIPDRIDPAFVTATIPCNEILSENTRRLLWYLDDATEASLGQEAAINDFTQELLRFLGFYELDTFLRQRYSIRFMICGDENLVAQPGLCLVQQIQRTSMILLIIQIDGKPISARNPEAQVIAEAIAAFQHNNRTRVLNGLDPLDSMTIPAITMIGTRPVFYKIPVTQQLSDAVAMGHSPVSKTEVVKCAVGLHPRLMGEGMEVPEFRREILQYYEAFRKMSKECWSRFTI